MAPGASTINQANSPPPPGHPWCVNCWRVAASLRPRTYRSTHGTLIDVSESSKSCHLCAFICWTYGEDVLRRTEEQLEETGAGHLPALKVSFWDQYRIYEDIKEIPTRMLGIQIGMIYVGMPSHDFKSLERQFSGVMGEDWYSGRNYSGRAIWSSTDPVTFEMRRHTITNWLEECREKHVKCQRSSTIGGALASRILEVRRERDGLKLKLVNTSNIDLHNRPYIVLSHCWGGCKNDSVTTRSNIDCYMVDIPIENLPLTFREAIEIAYGIGIPHIWIDSLCIMQRDEEDWEHEAAKMSAIYRNATLTLSATSAKNSYEGCGISKALTPAKHLKYPDGTVYMALRDAEGQKDITKELKDLLKQGPVYTRAWTLQEQLLSRRILHATHKQFVWQCAELLESEDTLLAETHQGGMQRLGTLETLVPEYMDDWFPYRHNIRSRWWQWVEAYNSRNLSHTSDHYAAFAGLANLYRDFTNDEPIFGLWKKDLHHQLAWETGKSHSAWEPLETPRKPSWTWMTYPHGSCVIKLQEKFAPSEGIILRKLDAPIKATMVYQAEVLDIDYRWSGKPVISEPDYGILTLRGRFSRVDSSHNTAQKATYNLLKWPNFDLDFGTPDEYRVFDVLWLSGWHSDTPAQKGVAAIGLVLIGTDKEGEFRRVGRMEHYISYTEGTLSDEYLLGSYRTITLV